MSETELAQHDPFPAAGRHVLGRVGLCFADGGRTLTLDPDPVLIDAGHVSFGVLGVLFDMASSTALDRDAFVPFVHADITVHRLRQPNGPMAATARFARRGRRTGIVVVDLHDEAGALVATSTQEIVFRGQAPEPTPELRRIRSSFQSMFDGTCRLTQPLHHELGIGREDDGPTWSMELGPDRTNGFGALHGGVATTLIDMASAGVVAERRAAPARTVSAAVRYLAPAQRGPFRLTPQVLHDDGTLALVRAPVVDADGHTVILAEVHVTAA